MKKADRISIVDKVDLRSPANTIRRAALNHCKEAKALGCTKGIFISQNPNGTIEYDIWGCDGSEAVALLEETKHCKLKDMYG